MSGVRRLVIGDITQGKLRGKALGDALAKDLNSEECATSAMKKKIDSPNSKTYGKKK